VSDHQWGIVDVKRYQNLEKDQILSKSLRQE